MTTFTIENVMALWKGDQPTDIGDFTMMIRKMHDAREWYIVFGPSMMIIKLCEAIGPLINMDHFRVAQMQVTGDEDNEWMISAMVGVAAIHKDIRGGADTLLRQSGIIPPSADLSSPSTIIDPPLEDFIEAFLGGDFVRLPDEGDTIH